MSHVTQKNQTDFVVTVTDGDGAAIDITGYGVAFLLARRRGDAPLVSLSVGSGVTITNAAAGEFTAALTQAQADIVGTVYYEAITTDGSGNVKTVASGYVTFNATSAP